MNVETFEVEEIQGELGNMAADSEAAEIISKLGLNGQAGYLNQESCTRFPYRLMTPAEHTVYSLVFPVREKLEAYSAGIIPLRVLQVAAWVRENPAQDMKAGIYVWHTGVAKEDPVLVGHTANYGGQFYLLARWGDALPSWEELTAKAKRIWIAKAKARISKEISQWNMDRESLDSLATELFETGDIKSGNNGYTLSKLL